VLSQGRLVVARVTWRGGAGLELATVGLGWFRWVVH
jgi:hypothetical protein